MTTGATTASEYDRDASCPVASSTRTVMSDVPGDVGVPDTTPVAASSTMPAGRVPEVSDHVVAPSLPTATSVLENGTDATASPRDGVATASCEGFGVDAVIV